MADYIDRDAVISEIERREALMVGDKRISVDAMKSFIKNRPVVDVALVVHGHWITRNDKGVISMTHPYMCSRCWRVEMTKEPYCNCGAKMDGGDDGNADSVD